MVKKIAFDQLKTKLNQFKNGKLVLVTGCFDVLHPAHKEFLKAAKNQGDFLIVGLESDKRVKNLKGSSRPVNSLFVRVDNLVALGSVVDLVFSLPEEFESNQAHAKLLQLIKPDVLAVSESSPHLEKKRRLINKTGGQLFVFPHNPRYSSTKVLTKTNLII